MGLTLPFTRKKQVITVMKLNGLLILSIIGSVATYWMLPNSLKVPLGVLFLLEMISLVCYFRAKKKGNPSLGYAVSGVLFPLWMMLEGSPKTMLSSSQLMAKVTGGGISFWSHVFTFPLLLLALGVIFYLFKKQGKRTIDSTLPLSIPLVTAKRAKTEQENPWVDFYLGEEVEFDFKRMMKKEV
jgi:cbb3-type cytochrome oxidase subunit 3